MLRKSATAIAIAAGLVSISGQSFAQQSAVTSSVQRLGAATAQGNQYDMMDPWVLYLLFGIGTTAIIWSASDDDGGPISPT